ncbi:MAG: bifunctional pantoate--beta-alanine ligase/(d)CMP kinase [Cyanobacteria bacterium K_Offshore_surface_m2_239]|nr:bifunctional pantoate--beta-alanine ligase/(d)CMP kinase [Cyanobacteria bacterium K_Offshore_surface_m2_239]
MDVLRTERDLADWRASLPPDILHFVPTMGALHAGHLQLIQRAAADRWWGEPRVLVSVFVNPLQFGVHEDFDRYPRRLEEDASLAAAAGAQALFAPAVSDIYPRGVAGITHVVPPASLQTTLCGLGRPGHFEGVATVVARLLAMARPRRLFLGEKDWQQLVVLRQVVRDLGLPVVIEAMASVRRPDGLALSSRLAYLQPEELRRATALPAALNQAATSARQGLPVEFLLATLRTSLDHHGLLPEYVALVDGHTLQPVERPQGLTLLAAAVHCGSTRLIDHLFLMSRAPIVAIDGPAGAGKSTVTRALARRLNLTYLDTGAMYRALAWWVLRQGVNPEDPTAVEPLLADLALELSQDQEGLLRLRLNGQDISTAIRAPEVTAVVSAVAAHPCVRNTLTAQQRRLGERGGLVAEGRDTGTAVFPDAECKIFLTATVAERARRRALDLRRQGFAVSELAELERQIAERDRRDSTRSVAPLRQAADAVVLVTDGMGIEAVLEALVDAFRARVPEEAWPGLSGAGA